MFTILFISATFNGTFIWNFVSAESNNSSTNWTKYSSSLNGLSFEYPSTWKIKYLPNSQEINITNPDGQNGINIQLADQDFLNIVKIFPSLKDAVTNLMNSTDMTIIQPFVEKSINGFPAATGIISGGDTDSGKIKKVIFLQDNESIYIVGYFDSAEHYDTADSQTIMNKFISSLNISKSSLTTPSSDLNNVKNNTWTKFSSRGLTFEYPADWKVLYPDINNIVFENSSNPSNQFVIQLPTENNRFLNFSNGAIDGLNSGFSNDSNATIIMPFKEIFIADEDAAIGKLRGNDTDLGEQIANLVLINHDNKIYRFLYSNTPDQFDTNGSTQTMNHIFTSLEFTTPILNDVRLK